MGQDDGLEFNTGRVAIVARQHIDLALVDPELADVGTEEEDVGALHERVEHLRGREAGLAAAHDRAALADLRATVARTDFLAADAAAKAMNATFSLGTSGWTLGPMEDRAYFDKVLPRDWTLTSIDENLGTAGVEVAYAQVQNRSAKGGKWIIPWAEDGKFEQG